MLKPCYGSVSYARVLRCRRVFLCGCDDGGDRREHEDARQRQLHCDVIHVDTEEIIMYIAIMLK